MKKVLKIARIDSVCRFDNLPYNVHIVTYFVKMCNTTLGYYHRGIYGYKYKYKYKWGFVERGLQIVQGR